MKYDHSHPGDPNLYNFPSGTPDYNLNDAGKYDIGGLTDETNIAISRGQPIPVYKIYVPGRGYRKFNINSTYKQFSRIPDYYYEK